MSLPVVGGKFYEIMYKTTLNTVYFLLLFSSFVYGFWGLCPQTPTGALPLNPAGGLPSLDP